MTPEQQQQLRVQLESWTGKMAREVIGPQVPERLGFAFLAFDFEGGASNLAYCSNANRADMVQALQELLDNLRKSETS